MTECVLNYASGEGKGRCVMQHRHQWSPSLDGDGGEPAAPPRESTEILFYTLISLKHYLSKFSNFSSLNSSSSSSGGITFSFYRRGKGGGLNGPTT